MATSPDNWIQDKHLGSDAMAQYRRQFEEHPGRLIVIGDFLHPDKAQRLARCLEQDLEYETKHGLYSVEEPVSETEWTRADERDRFFRFRQPTTVRPESQLSPNLLTYMQFKSAFADQAFMSYFERTTGLEMAPSHDDVGAHAMTGGDFMRPHDDDNRDRQLAFILYLTPEWQPEYGGALRMVAGDGLVTEVPPTYNSMAMFDVRAGTTHEVLPVAAGAGDAARRTIGGWYHRRG